MRWEDITGYHDWNVSILSDGNYTSILQYSAGGGGGCYGLEGEVGLWGGGLKRTGDVEIGDVLTGWNETGNEFMPAKVLNVTIHTKEAPYILFHIITENYYVPHSYKDVLITGNHSLPYFEPDIARIIEPTNETVKTKVAQDFQIGDFLFGFKEQKRDDLTGEIKPAHFQAYQVVSISKIEAEAVIDIQTTSKWFMGHYLLQRKIPETGYTDWLPVRVTYTYTLPTNIAPFFIGALVFFLFAGFAIIIALKRRKS